MNMENVSELYIKAEEILSPILRHARLEDPNGFNGDWCLGKPFSEVQDAVSFLKQGCEAGYRPAQIMFAECLYRGFGIRKDIDAARELFNEVSMAEDPIALFFLGLMYEKKDAVFHRDDMKAYDLYRKSASLGNLMAMVNLGLMYEKGNGIEQDYAEALKWYQKAAAQGDSKAQYRLGYMYTNGRGVEQNHAEALKWYLKAAENFSEAQYCLGEMYAKGRGVEQNDAEALKWYLKAAEYDSETQFLLAEMYDYGHGVQQNDMEALKWYLKAEEYSPSAQYRLGEIYEYGMLGVKQDWNKASDLYVKAAEQGHEEAQIKSSLIDLGVYFGAND